MNSMKSVYVKTMLSLHTYFLLTISFSHVALVRVRVSQGILEGELLDTVTGDGQYYSFKGVRYAAPPVGTLRFKAAQPPRPWRGVRSAKAHGSKCPQVDIFTLKNLSNNEDCLFLNIYTPILKPPKLMPVMFYIHGGGYKSGSGDVDGYGPEFLMSHGVVLVTINYRLDLLGFLCIDSKEVPGNAGLKDQVAALLWVKENVEQFGGDPNKVTIFGQSVGGVSVGYHILSPMSKGLFVGAISMSGVPFCDFVLPYRPRQRAFALGKKLGIHTNNATELLHYLQKVPTDKLYDIKVPILASEEITNTIIKMYDFVPVVEKDFGNSFITQEPMKILKTGRVNEVNMMFGYTDQEVLTIIKTLPIYMEPYSIYDEMFAPVQILRKSTPDTILEVSKTIRRHYFGDKPINLQVLDKFATYASDITFIYNVNRFLFMLPDIKKKKYLYKFSAVSGRNHYGNEGKAFNIIGAAHLDDILYLFDAKAFNMTINKNSLDYHLVHQVCRLFTNFAKYGNPTPKDCDMGVIWPEYDRVNKGYLGIGNTLTAGADPDGQTTAFWKHIYERAGFPYYG